MLCPELHSDARDQLEKLLNAAMAKETSERSKGLVKAADECGKLRAELEGQNKAQGATVTEIRDKISIVKTEAKAALDTVEKDFNEKIGSHTLTQVKDGAERALSATKGALLEALEKHKAESLKALQTARTELTKEREEAEGRTTAAREALGMAIRHRLSSALHCAFAWYTY